jgi:hypothetical protein
MTIDVDFDFTSDSFGYWEDYWNRNDGMGSGKTDPDLYSPTLQLYQKLLWSRVLPNGEFMDLEIGTGANYLTWKNFRFGSDSIIVSFRYKKYRYMIEQVMRAVGDYKKFYENYTHKSYTIGGEIIFPKHVNSINQMRGTNALIADRWDLTLECIRRYYNNDKSPLYETLKEDKQFFSLFKDFKGYVDFFFLQDAVTEDYSKVNMWCGKSDFVFDGLPKTVDEYLRFIDEELRFVEKRNMRIKEYCKSNCDLQ